MSTKEPDEITFVEDDLHVAGQLAVVTAILTASGGFDQKKARAEGRRILREAILDVHHLIEDADVVGQSKKQQSKKR